MLKITITETPTEQRWVLEGRLAQPWVDALRTQWRQTHRGRQGRTSVVDLNDVTSMDHSGEQILRAMLREGVHCIARGVYTTHRLVALRRAVGGAGMRAMALTRVVGDRSARVAAGARPLCGGRRGYPSREPVTHGYDGARWLNIIDRNIPTGVQPSGGRRMKPQTLGESLIEHDWGSEEELARAIELRRTKGLLLEAVPVQNRG